MLPPTSYVSRDGDIQQPPAGFTLWIPYIDFAGWDPCEGLALGLNLEIDRWALQCRRLLLFPNFQEGRTTPTGWPLCLNGHIKICKFLILVTPSTFRTTQTSSRKCHLRSCPQVDHL